MPRVKSVKSLTKICINFIVENQEIFCKRFLIGELKNGVDDALDLDEPSTNPFDALPNVLLQELMKHLRKKQTSAESFMGFYKYPVGRPQKDYYRFRETYQITPLLKLLMTPRLRTLDLTLIKCVSDISDVLHLATVRCPNLETLRLDPTSHQYIRNFNFIPKFEKLRILDIEFPETDDECLNLIGKHCPDLRELYCSYNELTDDGIQKLCVDGNCKSIRLLSLLRCSKITTKGIKLALENLPQLKILYHECLLECLAEIAQSAVDQQLLLPKYSLTTLFMLRFTVYQSGSLQQSVLLCPNVTRVYLETSDYQQSNLGTAVPIFKNVELLSLLSLEKLSSIDIRYDGYEKWQETICVVPLLKKFGWCLRKIDFRSFSIVDISAIIKYCPNLEDLRIYDTNLISKTTETIQPNLTILHNLKRLYLDYTPISSETLSVLLSYPSLSHITILHINGLNDGVLQRAANLHSFRNLECLTLTECNSVTKNGIDIFLQESNVLRKIVLSRMYGITRGQVQSWNDNAVWLKKNWKFKFYIILTRNFTKICLGGDREILGEIV